ARLWAAPGGANRFRRPRRSLRPRAGSACDAIGLPGDCRIAIKRPSAQIDRPMRDHARRQAARAV
ncbi:hypothetical protein K6W24_26655, partial [Burkholderia dolosa]|uniref:hypothetical protein n=1 Tax=Burkholderia dolosa TaxID=152500 RepID=UPI001C93548E